MTSLLNRWQIQLQISFHPHSGPDLNPVDYKIWSVTQEKVYQIRIDKLLSIIIITVRAFKAS